MAQPEIFDKNAYVYKVKRKYGFHYKYSIEIPANILHRLDIPTHLRIKYCYISSRNKQDVLDRKVHCDTKYQQDMAIMMRNYLRNNWTQIITLSGELHPFHFYPGELDCCKEFHRTPHKDCAFCPVALKAQKARMKPCGYCGMIRCHRYWLYEPQLQYETRTCRTCIVFQLC
eukprot:672518_1